MVDNEEVDNEATGDELQLFAFLVLWFLVLFELFLLYPNNKKIKSCEISKFYFFLFLIKEPREEKENFFGGIKNGSTHLSSLKFVVVDSAFAKESKMLCFSICEYSG